MIRLAEPTDEQPPRRTPRGADTKAHEDSPSTAYGRVFWLCYLSNATTMIAISMLVRYSDFVKSLGGDTYLLGWIVGLGMVGSMIMRVAQGVGIDRYGARRIWLGSLVLFIGTLAAHLLVRDAHGTQIFLLRILFSTSVAGIFGASVTYVSRTVPPQRMAEIIGTLGSSGFLGIFTGPFLGDWIFSYGGGREQIVQMFLFCGALGCLSLISAIAATVGEARPSRRRRAPVWALVRRYNPGFVLLVAIAVGAGISMPNTFLRPFTEELGISTVGVFFSVYAVTAFAARIASARLPSLLGTRPMILYGLTFLAASMLLYLLLSAASTYLPETPAWEAWKTRILYGMLVIPALAAGTAHALLFPSVVSSASTRFPVRYRGLGTTLVMGFFDMGTLLGAPAMGGILYLALRAGAPPFPTMFVCVALGLVLTAAAFWTVTRQGLHERPRVQRRARRRPTIPAPNRLPANRKAAPATVSCSVGNQPPPAGDPDASER
ncbi:MAG: MFS transporter [Pirellulaceae bacterium]